MSFLQNHEPENNFRPRICSLEAAVATLRYYQAAGLQREIDDFFNNRRIGEHGVYRTGKILCLHIGDDLNSKGHV